MKPTTYRRIRRHPANREAASLKKDNQREQQFFGEPVHEPFFKPFASSHTEGNIQRKCAECEKEEKQLQQKPNMKNKNVQQLPENSAGWNTSRAFTDFERNENHVVQDADECAGCGNRLV